MAGGSSDVSSSRPKAAPPLVARRRRADMAMRKFLTIAALSLTILVPGTSAQQSTSPTPVLSALDYLEIEQLVYRYGYALDTGADNGFAYADLYAPDATFTGTNQ